ncbi:hypothetical protein Pth03_44990 [Planotetraspora thailandica]|uniref:DUF4241 domain-containing protein n=1 Tax=Planotetraspora thailandica TaxID=487172 RepID=A0A8J3V4U1_9ACTN|nr:hypothetical protein [Planotetraspora thailandica]GII56110.1 hypothetical protein Pth03_44990 [Planotetraspora thailandica]
MTTIRIRIDDHWITVTSADIGTASGARPTPGEAPIHIVGGIGTDGSWPAEYGKPGDMTPAFAVTGLTHEEACELGRRSGQDVIYAWSYDCLAVFSCVDGSCSLTGWRSDTSAEQPAGQEPTAFAGREGEPVTPAVRESEKPPAAAPPLPSPTVLAPAPRPPAPPKRERLAADCLYPSRPLGETEQVLLSVRAWRMFGRRISRVLHVRDGRLELLSRRGKDPVEVIDLGPVPTDPLAVALDHVPDLLTFPSEAAVEIKCPAGDAERVADLITPVVDDFYSVEELYDYDDDWDDEEWDEEDWDDYKAGHKRAEPREDERTYRWYDGLTTVRIHINDILHLAAEVDGRWILVPMDPHQEFPPLPMPGNYFTEDSYGFDGGSPISNSHWWTGSGNIRGDLHIAWAAWDEGGEVLIARCSTEEFDRRVAAWGYLDRPDEGVIEE